MRSRAARLTSTAIACLALAAAAFFLFSTERDIAVRRNGFERFDDHARTAVNALASLRTGQQAYVTTGQVASAWFPRVESALQQTSNSVDSLRTLAATAAAQNALIESSAAVTELANADKRAREYMAGDQTLMASDVVFNDGADAAARAQLQIETARVAEAEAYRTHESRQRQAETAALAGAGGLTAILLVLLACAPAPRVETLAEVRGALLALSQSPAETAADLALHDEAPPARPVSAEPAAGNTWELAVHALNVAAALCTDFNRVRSLADVKRVMARAADAMDASGLVVWIGSSAGGDLTPIAAHGYSDQVLGLMRPVPRNADNAAAAAYRSAKLQVVPAKPGTSLGAVVAPLISPEGCIGALTAEIKDNGEVSETIHALASIFASQLSGVLAASVAAPAATPQTKAATA